MTPQENADALQPGQATEPAQAAEAPQAGQVIPPEVIAEQNATTEGMREQGVPVVDVKAGEPTEEEIQEKAAAAAAAAAAQGQIMPVNHPMKRLRRLEVVVDRILEKAGASYSSPISAEDAAELREFLKAGDIEESDDDE